MKVYHGSTVAVESPHIIQSEIGRDFGFAFYVTEIQEQAERWARRRAIAAGREEKSCTVPIVSVYEWDDESAGLKVMKFADTTSDWLHMILKCRSDVSFSHGYDIVIGKIADDTVGETVQYVLQGIMREADALKRLRFEKINNQIAFCTTRALAALQFTQSYRVGDL